MQTTMAERGSGVQQTARSYQVVVVGGGTAGISVAARLARAGVKDLAVIEPSAKHSYQPLWTLVGAGIVDKAQTERNESEVMPRAATWIRDRVAAFAPQHNAVELAFGSNARV